MGREERGGRALGRRFGRQPVTPRVCVCVPTWQKMQRQEYWRETFVFHSKIEEAPKGMKPLARDHSNRGQDVFAGVCVSRCCGLVYSSRQTDCCAQ